MLQQNKGWGKNVIVMYTCKDNLIPLLYSGKIKIYVYKYVDNNGVPVVAQWLTNPTRNHEVAGSVPALAQWVNDPVLP